jgi:tRNA-dihydrouridine synthase A
VKGPGCWDVLERCVAVAAAMAVMTAAGGGAGGGRRGGIRLCAALSIRASRGARLRLAATTLPRHCSSPFESGGGSFGGVSGGSYASTSRSGPKRSGNAPCPSFRSTWPLRSSSSQEHDPWLRSDDYQSRFDDIGKASRLTLAPMMDYTDRHFRQLVRLVSNRTLLYTEMVSANAVAHESRRRRRPPPSSPQSSNDHPNRYASDSDNDDPLYLARFLAQSPREGPSILQLGGSDPQLLFEASKTVAEMSRLSYHDLDPNRDDSLAMQATVCDYTGLNLNCGCPSPKVAGKGCFGAALMDDPDLVRDLVRAMHDGADGQLPVSVKCRIGTDSPFDTTSGTLRYNYGDDEYQRLCRFIETVAQDGIVADFGVHARIAVLGKSFSPADNRKIPPLRYDVVHRLVRDYPTLRFTINGGFNSIEHVQRQMEECPDVAGVMVGRAWAADPWSFAMADTIIYDDDQRHGHSGDRNRWNILQQFGAYADHEEHIWGSTRIRRFLLRAVSSLFAGEPNAKKYRIALDEIASQTKRLHQQQHHQSHRMDPPLSELLLEAAQKHLSEETRLRTPRESYEMRLWQDRKDREGAGVVSTGSSSSSATLSSNIAEWQLERKSGESSYNQTLQRGLVADT